MPAFVGAEAGILGVVLVEGLVASAALGEWQMVPPLLAPYEEAVEHQRVPEVLQVEVEEHFVDLAVDLGSLQFST